MYWEAQEREPVDEEGYLLELAAFITARSGGGPAVLWTEYEPTAAQAAEGTEAAAELAVRLTALLGRTALALPQTRDEPYTVRARQADAELVVLQHRAATDVLASTPAETPDTALRLRSGQILFLPRHSTCTLAPAPGSRYVVLQIAAARSDSGAAPPRALCGPGAVRTLG